MVEKISLITTSKIKSFIKEDGGLKTSATAIDALNLKVETIIKDAIASCKADGRKTLQDRDFE